MNSQLRRTVIPGLVLGVPLTFVLLWGSGALYRRVPPGLTPEAQAAEAHPVAVAPVGYATSPEALELNGTVQAQHAAVIASKLLATITAVHVQEGDRVLAGQPLVRLDARDLEAQSRRAQAGRATAEQAIRAAEMAVRQAQAQHELAAATRRRVAGLHADGTAPDQAFEEAEGQAKTAAAALAQAREQLAASRARLAEADAGVRLAEATRSYAEVAAPFDGVVVKKWAELGATAGPGAPLVQVERGPFRLEVAVSERDAQRLEPGGTVKVTIDATGGTLAGAIAQVVPAVDPASRTAIAKVSLPPEAAVRSGMTGRARFHVGQAEKLLAPAAGVVRWYHLTSAFAVDAEGHARLRLVRLGAPEGDRIEVLAGLTEGERIVVAGHAGLRDGMKVEVQP